MVDAVKRCHVRVVPVKIRTWDTDAVVEVSRVVAFRGECTCGWKGSSRSLFAAARGDCKEHHSQSG